MWRHHLSCPWTCRHIQHTALWSLTSQIWAPSDKDLRTVSIGQCKKKDNQRPTWTLDIFLKITCICNVDVTEFICACVFLLLLVMFSQTNVVVDVGGSLHRTQRSNLQWTRRVHCQNCQIRIGPHATIYQVSQSYIKITRKLKQYYWIGMSSLLTISHCYFI